MAVAVMILGVGWAHETLYERGLTERALDWACSPLTSDANWSVGETTSLIMLGGEPADVRQAAATVTARVAAGPQQLEPARLTTPSEPDGPLLKLRYGNQSYGLAGATRYGYQTAGPEAVRAWLRNIGANTCLGITADVELEPFPFEARPPLEEPSRQQMRSTPGARVSAEGFGLSWLAAKTPTAAVASQLMMDTVASIIPDPGPTLPPVHATVRSIGADTDHVSVVSTFRNVSAEHVGEIGRALQRLCHNDPDVSEIVAAVDRHARSTEMDALATAVADTRRMLLKGCGYAMPPQAELDTDPAVLADQIRRHCETLLMTCAELPPAEMLAASTTLSPHPPASGRSFKPAYVMTEVGMSKQTRYEASDSALTFRGAETATATVDTLALVEKFPDGERTLFDRNGVELHVDPLQWRGGRKLVEWVDDHSGAAVIEREESLPASHHVARAALRARPGVAMVMTAFVAAVAVAFLVGAATTSGQRVALLLVGLAFVAVVAILVKVVLYTLRLQRRANV